MTKVQGKEWDEIKKKINRESLHVSDLTEDSKTRFKKLANEQFKGHYGWTLKWLLDFRDGILTGPGEQVEARLQAMEEEIKALREDINYIGSSLQSEPKRTLKMCDGNSEEVKG